MLVSKEIKTFRLLPASITDLAKQLELYPGTVSKIAEKMIKNGLAKKKKLGRKAILESEQTLHSQKLEEIIKMYPNFPLEELLTNTNLEIISLLNQPLNKNEISKITGASRQWIYHELKILGKYGILLKNKEGYYNNPSHKAIYDFSKNYYKYKNYKEIEKITDDATIIWQQGNEILLKSKKTLKEYPTTAITAFSNYNLPMISNLKYYFISKRKLKLSDIIIHTILINEKSKTYNAYACLLYDKTRPKDLMKKARIYGLTDHISELIYFLNKHESKNRIFPSWDEYLELAKQYKVR